MNQFTFHESEIDGIPEKGFRPATIVTADFRNSASGNRMLQVTYALDGVEPPWDRVPDFFVLDASSKRANALARKRLVSLYHACGLSPRPGQPISPKDLIDARLEILIGHAFWDETPNDPRLRVAGYRSLGSTEFPPSG